MAQSGKNLPALQEKQETEVWSLCGEDPLGKEPTPVFLPEESPHAQKSPGGYSPWDCKELDMAEAIQHAAFSR